MRLKKFFIHAIRKYHMTFFSQCCTTTVINSHAVLNSVLIFLLLFCTQLKINICIPINFIFYFISTTLHATSL